MLKRFLVVLLALSMSLTVCGSSFADDIGKEFTPMLLPILFTTTSEVMADTASGAAALFLDAQFSAVNDGVDVTKAARYEKCYITRTESVVAGAFRGDELGNSTFVVIYDVRGQEGQYALLSIPFSQAQLSLSNISDDIIHEVNGSDWTELFLQYIDVIWSLVK